MRILLCSTYYGFATTPDRGYGGMERVNWFLARELVRNGHAVTLLGGHGTELVGARIYNYPNPWEEIIDWIRENKGHWDILHDMTHGLEINAALKNEMKVISTLENPNDPKEAINVVVPSKFSVKYTLDYYGRQTRYVYNAVAEDYYPFYSDERDCYVAQVSVMEQRKGVLESIRAAKQAGMTIHLAGLKSNSASYQRQIDALIDGESVVWHGEVRGQEKLDLMGRAVANMLCVNWAEPGSMVGPESLSLGTPLIANKTGCVQEYVIPGVSGFVVEEESQISNAILQCRDLHPEVVKEAWRNSEFRAEVMARRYEALYQEVLDGVTW